MVPFPSPYIRLSHPGGVYGSVWKYLLRKVSKVGNRKIYYSKAQWNGGAILGLEARALAAANAWLAFLNSARNLKIIKSTPMSLFKQTTAVDDEKSQTSILTR